MENFDLKHEILKAHSKAQCTLIYEWVADDQQRFDELFGLFLTGEDKVKQRAAWPLSYCVLAHPFLIKKGLKKLLDNLQSPNLHDAIKRNTVRILKEIDIPTQYQGQMMDYCFRFVESPKEAVAVKAFSLAVLGKLAKQYPEILPEIKLLIESELPHQTAAFKSSSRQLLKSFGSE